jgi:hypothetical protein
MLQRAKKLNSIHWHSLESMACSTIGPQKTLVFKFCVFAASSDVKFVAMSVLLPGKWGAGL